MTPVQRPILLGYGIFAVLLILPPTLLNVLIMVGALLSASPIMILAQLAVLYGFFCLWQLVIRTINRQTLTYSKTRIAGLVMPLVYGIGLTVIYSYRLLGNFDAIYYYAYGPALCLISTLLLRNYLNRTHPFQDKKDSGSRWWQRPALSWLFMLLGWLWLTGFLLLLILSMLGTYSVHTFGYVGEFLHPFNIVNWLMIAVLAAPGWICLRLGNTGASKS